MNNKFSISTKILTPIFLIFLFVTIIFVLVVSDLQSKKKFVGENVAQTRTAISHANKLRDLENQISFQIFFFNSKPDRTRLEIINQKDREINGIFEKLISLSDSEYELDYLYAYYKFNQESKKLRTEMVGFIEGGDSGNAEVSYNKWKTKGVAVEASVSDIVSFYTSRLDRNISSFNELINKTIFLYVLILTATILVVLLSYIYFRKFIVIPITKLTKEARNISSNNFDWSLDLKNEDELGILGNAFREMTENLKDSYSRLRLAAFHDPLTGLPNRKGLEEEFANSKDDPANKEMGLVLLDLDRFKMVNDTLGHDAGDEILKEISIRLRAAVNPRDFVARLGGDEFVALIKNVSPDELNFSVEKIFKALETDFLLRDFCFYISSSVGISVYPRDGEILPLLLKRADLGLYEAKSRGKNKFCFYEQRLERDSGRFGLENDLRKSILNKELVLFYQPIVSVGANRLSGLEALIRWRHPRLGLLLPKEFIPIAEEMGFLEDIERWVFETSASQIKRLGELGYSGISISVNISAKHFLDKGFVSEVKDVLSKHPADGTIPAIEITEGAAMSDTELAFKQMEDLKRQGVKVWIDDFGTGYSSLSYFGHLPISKVKIDRFFVKDIMNHDHDAAIIKAIISVAHDMNVPVVAEGVERIMQLALLKSYGCDEAQGFLISEPLSENKLEEWLAEQCVRTSGGAILKEDPLLMVNSDTLKNS